MKIHQIISESDVNEAPGGGIIGNLAKKAGAKIAGAVGMKGTQAGLQGKLDANSRAKELYQAFRAYIGQTGGDPKKPTADQLKDFMATQKMPTGRLNNLSGVLGKKQVDDILQGAAQDTFKGAAGQAAVGAEPEPEQPLGQKFGAQAGAPETPRASGGPGVTPTAGAGAKAGGGKIPPKLQKQIDALNPQQKQELVKLL